MVAHEAVVPKCLLISPFRGEEKHPANPLAVSQRFLNFGALSIASFLTQRGWQSLVLDEYSLPPERRLVGELRYRFGNEQPLLVGVSSISSYSADQARNVLRELAALWPDVPRVIGGQHFVGYWGSRFLEHMPEADMLVSGEAEAALLDILIALQRGKKLQSLAPSDLPANVYWKAGQVVHQGTRPASTRLPLDDLLNVDCALYPGSERLFPSIEFSRGCPYACVFCANGLENRLGYRRAASTAVGEAVGRLVEIRDERPVQFYMQASNFSVTKDEAVSLAASFGSTGDIAHWRTEVRVDGVADGAMRSLANAGLRVLDLGLESACPQILKIMRKTTNPKAYLLRAEKVLSEATECGIFTKVNFLIHPGDTPDTVAESWDWLKSHSDVISGVSSGVTLEYPGTPLSAELARYETEFGTKSIPHPLSRWGVNYLQPSSSLGLQEAELLATSIAQSMQTRAEFAKSKSFGYLGADASANAILASLPEASHATPYRS